MPELGCNSLGFKKLSYVIGNRIKYRVCYFDITKENATSQLRESSNTSNITSTMLNFFEI